MSADFYQTLLENNPKQVEALKPEWNLYIPHVPSAKQLAFLMLPHREVFYGGAAGGGKSDALLAAALQYVEVPGYSAIIFRRTFTDLKLPGALIDRSLEWLTDPSFPPEIKPRWDAQQHSWHFPSGATLAFGHLDSELVKFRYQSAEFQFIAFDELTHFQEDDYLYLFSRLRRPTCNNHITDGYQDDCPLCLEYRHFRRVPLRMRAASNPGGIGHQWVKDRFRIEEVGTDSKGRKIFRGTHPKRPHVPAFVRDNPALDEKEYTESLMELDPVTREQLLSGDWDVSADARFRKSWFEETRYSMRGPNVVLGKDGKGQVIELKDCRIFATIDPAASTKEGPGDKVIWKRMPSWTVIMTFLLTKEGHLIVWDICRFQKEIPDLLAEVLKNYELHEHDRIGVEADGLGIGVYQMLNRSRLPIHDIKSRSKDKLVRATHAMNRAEQGKLWIPQQGVKPWVRAFESEIFVWTGHPHETSDQIDALAHGANIAGTDGVYTDFGRYSVPGMIGVPNQQF